MALFSIGDCPVCADSGAVVLLVPRGGGSVFYYCPLCGVAWARPPNYPKLDSILGIRDFAPDGALLPTPEEAMWSGCDVRELPDDRWLPLLEEALLPREK
jgi:hypothetical protein